MPPPGSQNDGVVQTPQTRFVRICRCSTGASPAALTRNSAGAAPAGEQLPLHAGRFNERLVLSLAATKACLFLDDELNILPTSAEGQTAPLPDGAALGVQQQDPELKELCDSLADTQVCLFGAFIPRLARLW